MARYKRQISRGKNEFSFSKKQPVKKSNFQEFKDNFNFKWIKTDLKSIIILIIDFLIPSILLIPLLLQYVSQQIAFVIGHGLITSLLIVLSFYLFYQEKPSIWALFGRYLFGTLVISVVSFVILLIA